MHQFQTLSSDSFAAIAAQIRLVATDVDGTLTQAGKFSPRLLQTLEALQTAGMPVILVTGRSAGWVSALVNYLPVAGAIAENGCLYFPKADAEPAFLTPIDDIAAHRQALEAMFATLQQTIPYLQPATDNPYRLTDWTFDVAGLSQADIDACAAACLDAGWGFTYSNVQGHIKPRFDKADGLLVVLRRVFPEGRLEQGLTVGDSPNDQPLFNREIFAHSVGVANVREYGDRMEHFPAYIAERSEVAGFGELCQQLLNGPL
ncbi:HAD family hydrolase [filamentous cyanobacterium CCP5]|nr:HAD family hydrolase [filamentous cyanobacterium CCP5]